MAQTFHVTVGQKSPQHLFSCNRYPGQPCSKLAYYIDGVEGKELRLERGNRYIFRINTPGHPFYLTTDLVGAKGSQDGRSLIPQDMVTDEGTMEVLIDDTFPDRFFYQCQAHPRMGSRVEIISQSGNSREFENDQVIRINGQKRTVRSNGSNKIDRSYNISRSDESHNTPRTIKMNGRYITIPQNTRLSRSAPGSTQSSRTHNFSLDDLANNVASIYQNRTDITSNTRNTTTLNYRKPTGRYSLEPIISGPAPIAVVGSDPLLIADQNGVILSYSPSQDTQDMFIDLRPFIIELEGKYDERGLLDMVLSPNKDRLFVYYTNKDNVNELCEIDLKTREYTVLLNMDHKATYHNGGRLAFGPDGYLYLTTGDGGPQEDPQNRGQRLDTLSGKILRLDVSRPRQYRIPPDNPFINQDGAKEEIFAYGLRNPWGISFDGRNGRGYISDAGYKSREEVNVLMKGANYGWNIKEGTQITGFNPTDPQTLQLVDPLYEYETGKFPELNLTKESSTVIGGYPLSDDTYLFADFGGVIMRIDVNTGKLKYIDDISRLSSRTKFIRTFSRDDRGNIYMMTSDSMGTNGDVAVYRLQILE